MGLSEAIEAAAAVAGNHDISEICVTEEERRTGHLSSETLARARSLFRENGYLRVRDLFTPEEMALLDGEYRTQNARFLSGTNKQDKRPLFTVPIKGPFAEQSVLDNPYVSPLLANLLGSDYIIQALSAVVSYPGAPDQFLHRDTRDLFSEDNSVEATLPPYSVTMLVPLVDFTTETGCTRVWPGSHKITGTEEGLSQGSLDPEVSVGSVLLTDGRILHRGAANRSDRIRPLFYLTFHRAWMRDLGGYESRPPVDCPESVFRKLPKHTPARLAWANPARAARVRRKNALRRARPAGLRRKLFKDT